MQHSNKVRSDKVQGFAVGRELMDEELAGVVGGAGSSNAPATSSTDPNSAANNIGSSGDLLNDLLGNLLGGLGGGNMLGGSSSAAQETDGSSPGLLGFVPNLSGL
jgi:hypothetical protein